MKVHNKASKEKVKNTILIEAVIILASSIIYYIASTQFDIFEQISEFAAQHEDWEFDEIISMALFLMFGLTFFSVRRWKQINATNNVLINLNNNLQGALSEIKQLQGIIPICAECKNIRDDEGFWHQVESYIHNHSDAKFSHGICPECIKKNFPKLGKKNKSED